MPRSPLWSAIARTLRDEIAQGHVPIGSRLPTEAELARRFGVNRHTVRRAMAALTEEGLVHPRRGAGVFVADRPTEYPVGRRVRFHQNLRAAGRLPGKQVLSLATRPADGAEAAALEIAEGAEVHVYDGLSLADGRPIALFRSVFPAARTPGLTGALTRDSSVTAALLTCGITDYTRASTRIGASLATATQAVHLQLREGDPILATTGLNVTPDGRPIEHGLTWFSGSRVTLTMADDDGP